MISAKEAKKEHKKLKSCWSQESRLTQKILIGILQKLENREKKMLKSLGKFLAKVDMDEVK